METEIGSALRTWKFSFAGLFGRWTSKLVVAFRVAFLLARKGTSAQSC